MLLAQTLMRISLKYKAFEQRPVEVKSLACVWLSYAFDRKLRDLTFLDGKEIVVDLWTQLPGSGVSEELR